MNAIAKALEGQGETWLAGVARPLSFARWRSIGEATSIDRLTYGTTRYLRGDVSAPREELARLALPDGFEADGPVVVETLREDEREQYVGNGLEFHRDGDTPDAALVVARLRDALGRISRIPAAAAAVGALLAVVHVLRPGGPDYDVSYSDPALPFSIFVGIEGPERPQGDLRLAEGVLHECMHLQLTLIEEIVPLVTEGDDRLYSPWQGTTRPIQGVLHGLYVFRVIQDFHDALIAAGGLSKEDEAYLRRRIRLIEEEARMVGDLADNRDLTQAGRHLAARLLGRR